MPSLGEPDNAAVYLQGHPSSHPPTGRASSQTRKAPAQRTLSSFLLPSRNDISRSAMQAQAGTHSPSLPGTRGPTAPPYLVLGDAHACVPVAEEGDQRGSGRVPVVIIGRAVPVVQLDHPIVIGKLSVALSQVPSLPIAETSKRRSEKRPRPAAPDAGTGGGPTCRMGSSWARSQGADHPDCSQDAKPGGQGAGTVRGQPPWGTQAHGWLKVQPLHLH